MIHRRDALSYAFQQDGIGLGTDFAVKLNCDEAEGRKCKAALKSVREDSRGENQGQGMC